MNNFLQIPAKTKPSDMGKQNRESRIQKLIPSKSSKVVKQCKMINDSESETPPEVSVLRRSTRPRTKSAMLFEFDEESPEEDEEDNEGPSFEPEEIDNRNSLSPSPVDSDQDDQESLPYKEPSVEQESSKTVHDEERKPTPTRSQSFVKNESCICDECGKVFDAHSA